MFEDQQYSYLQLNAWANQIAHYYLSIGARKGDVIAVMLENRPELIASVIGLAKIGVIRGFGQYRTSRQSFGAQH